MLFRFLILLLVSMPFAGEPILGAFGLLFGQQVPDSLYLPGASSTSVPGIPRAFWPGAPAGGPAIGADSWAMVRPEAPVLSLEAAGARMEFMVQVDSVYQDAVIRVVAVAHGEPGEMRRQALILGAVLAKKYSLVSGPGDGSPTFLFSGGDGFLEVRANESGIVFDYYGREYSRWLLAARERIQQVTSASATSALSQF